MYNTYVVQNIPHAQKEKQMREFRVIVKSNKGDDLEVSGTAHQSWPLWNEKQRAEYLDGMYGAGNWRYSWDTPPPLKRGVGAGPYPPFRVFLFFSGIPIAIFTGWRYYIYMQPRGLQGNFVKGAKMIQEISYKGEKFSIECDREWDENVVFFLCEKLQKGVDIFRCILENHHNPYDFFSSSGRMLDVECGLDDEGQYINFSGLAENFAENHEHQMKKDELDYVHQKECYKR